MREWGHNGGECGICLRAVESYECPSDCDFSSRADGNACGTNNNLDNCGSGDYDADQRIDRSRGATALVLKLQ